MFGGINDNDKRNFILGGILIGVALGMYLFTRYVLFLVAPFIIGLLIAMLIKRPVYFLKKKFHINPVVGAILVLTLAVLVLVVFLTYVGGRFIYEVKMWMLNYDFYYNQFMGSVCNICYQVDGAMNFDDGHTYKIVTANFKNTMSAATDNVLPMLVEKSVGIITQIFVWGGGVFIAIVAVLFIIKDMGKLELWAKEGPYSKWFKIFFGRLGQFGTTYIRTQFIIMCITACICTIVMLMIGNGYPVMIGVLLGLMDALPLLGTGLVLVPWTIWALLSGNYVSAAVIFSGYCICYAVREFLEPKMMGGSMGIPPLVMLMSMYVGFLLFGVAGFVLGPAFYIVICEIMKYVEKII